MNKNKKNRQNGGPRNARNKQRAEVKAADLRVLEHPSRGAGATNGSDKVFPVIGRELGRGLSEASQNVGKALKREVEHLRHDLAAAGSRLKSARSVRELASITIDTGEKIGNRIVMFEEGAAEATRGTPIAPVLRMQARLRKRIVEASSRLARSMCRIDDSAYPAAKGS